MAASRGKSAVMRFMALVPRDIETKLLRPAARAAAKVIAEEAKELSISTEVTAAIKIASRHEEGRVVALVQVNGPGAYIGPWL